MNSLYGLVKPQHALDIAIAVCDCLGHGKNGVAVELLMETCAAETGLCTVTDTNIYSHGVGANQVDKSTFDWLKAKYAKSYTAKKIRQDFGIELGLVQYAELAFNPLLSFIFARLRYLPYPEQIPAKRIKRASYWKRLYNSNLGKGSVEHYMSMCECSLDKFVNDGDIRWT